MSRTTRFLPLRLAIIAGLLSLAILALQIPATPVLGQTKGEAAAASDLRTAVTLMTRIGYCAGPSFSPGGKKIAFISNMTGVPQVWIVATEGGWPTLVTALDDPVGGVRWSPDGAWLALSVAPGGGMNQQVYLVRPDGSGLKRITDGGKENNWLGPWSPDGKLLMLASNRAGPGAMDAYTYNFAGGNLKRVAKNPGIGYLTEISRDGKRAVLYRMQSRSSNDLLLLDLAKGGEKLLTKHDGPGRFFGGRFSPDGAAIYLASDRDGDMPAFARIKVADDGSPGPIEVLAERPDAELQDFQITEDGKTAALVWNVAGRNELAFLDLTSAKITPGPTLPRELIYNATFSKDGQTLAMTLLGSTAPTDVWVLERQTGKLRQVSHSPHAGVDLATLIQPELVRFEAHDGLKLSGWLYRPRGAVKTGPVVVSFHGGPEAQEQPGFRSDYQALLARGIGVFAPNIRGSSGFGKKFVNLDNGPLRFDAIKDLKSCVDYIVKAGVADPKRVGVMGGSYGGFMVMAGLTEYPDLFAGAVNICGVVNFETFFAQTEPWMAAISTVEYGDPKTQVDLLRRLSPIHKIDKVKAPTLVIHGANDTNVPVVEADQVVNNLKKRGVGVEYILFPDEGHGYRKTPNVIRANVAIAEWFEKQLKTN